MPLMPDRKNAYTPINLKQLTQPEKRNFQQMPAQEQIHPRQPSYVASKKQCQFLKIFSNS